ncbi:MAG: hypothetical protein ACXITR_08880 [Cyanobacterium sp.]
MKKILLVSGLALVTAFSISTPRVVAQGDDGVVMESEMVSVITGDGNVTTQRVNLTNRRVRYFDTEGSDGTVMRSYVECDVMGNNNVCAQYKVMENRNIRIGRPVRPSRR